MFNVCCIISNRTSLVNDEDFTYYNQLMNDIKDASEKQPTAINTVV